MNDHEWCRDTARDEAVRAAEDAAAVPSIQHRDLPEQVALLWASLGDIIGRVVRLEGEMDAGQDEETSPAVCDSAHLDAHRGESVRVVEEPAEIALITAERDLARAVRDGLRSQRDAARARVAELEAAPPPRGWLTSEERACIEELLPYTFSGVQAKRLTDLLARSTPPLVKMPPAARGETPLVRDLMWGQAIREAGGEVEE